MILMKDLMLVHTAVCACSGRFGAAVRAVVWMNAIMATRCDAAHGYTSFFKILLLLLIMLLYVRNSYQKNSKDTKRLSP